MEERKKKNYVVFLNDPFRVYQEVSSENLLNDLQNINIWSLLRTTFDFKRLLVPLKLAAQ